MTIRYTPPPIDQNRLFAELMDKFPSHKQPNRRPDSLLQELVHAYLMWWVLMITFPERRIAAPGPLWVVRTIHANDFEEFFNDCFQYLGRIPEKKDLWQGTFDFRRTHDTARSIHELFDFPDMVWEPILRAAQQLKAEPIVRIH